jgi:hypothetical protein
MSAHLLRLKLVMIYQARKLMRKFYIQLKLEEDNQHLERRYWMPSMVHVASQGVRLKHY